MITLAELSSAQIDPPEMSPVGFVKRTVGYTHFEIRNGQPAARERKIIGRLGSYGLDGNAVINKRTLWAGAYACTAFPDEREWQVLLNSDWNGVTGQLHWEENAGFIIRKFTCWNCSKAVKTRERHLIKRSHYCSGQDVWNGITMWK